MGSARSDRTIALALFGVAILPYASLVSAAALHVIGSMGWPGAIAAVAGLGLALRSNRRLALLCLPMIALVVLVIVPIGFVRIRYMIPAAYLLCFFAAWAQLELLRRAGWGGRPASRGMLAAAMVVVALVAGTALVRALDLTWQMRRDSRAALGAWLERHARPGDTVGYFGSPLKLPRLRSELRHAIGPGDRFYADSVDAQFPEFIVVIPQQSFEQHHEWSLRPSVFRSLIAGDAGYQQVFATQTPSLFSDRPITFVNPPVRLFARRDRIPEGASDSSWIDLPHPFPPDRPRPGTTGR